MDHRSTEFQKFRYEVTRAGFRAIDHGCGHWQIKGTEIVNFYPATNRISIQGKGKGFSGGMMEAIRAAGEPIAEGWTPEEIRYLDEKAGEALPIAIDLWADWHGTCDDDESIDDCVISKSAETAYRVALECLYRRNEILAHPEKFKTKGATQDERSNSDDTPGAVPTSFPDLHRSIQRKIESDRAAFHAKPSGGGKLVAIPEGFGDGYALPRDIAEHERRITEFLSRPAPRCELLARGEIFFQCFPDGYRRVNVNAGVGVRREGAGVQYLAGGVIRVCRDCVEFDESGSVRFKVSAIPAAPPDVDSSSPADRRRFNSQFLAAGPAGSPVKGG